MKSINFINGISLEERHKITWWWRISSLLVAAIFFIILILQIRQLKNYHAAYRNLLAAQQKETYYNTFVEKASRLQAEANSLKERLNCNRNHCTMTQKVLARCKALPIICSTTTTLQAFDESTNKVQIMVVAPSIEKVSGLLQELNKNGAFGFLSIVSMQPKDKSYLFTINGNC